MTDGGARRTMHDRFPTRSNRARAVVVAALLAWTGASTALPASATGATRSAPASWAPAPADLPDRPTYLYVAGDEDSTYYPGTSQTATDVTANIATTVTGNRLHATVRGRDGWGLTVELPGQTKIVPGTYLGLDARIPGAGQLRAFSQTTNCDGQHGDVTIDEAVYAGGSLQRVLIRFDMYCGYGAGGPLHGQFAWDATVPTPPGLNPSPAPGDLWAPPDGAVPATGDYAYIERDSINAGGGILIDPARRTGDLVAGWQYPGGGPEYGNRLVMEVYRGDEWAVSLDMMTGGRDKPFRVGLYDGLGDVGADPVAGSLRAYAGNLNDPMVSTAADEPASWYDRWFAVDEVATTDGRITHIAFRYCIGCRATPGSGALRGAVRWSSAPTATRVLGSGQRRGGDIVQIDGSNLAAASSVTIGGVAAEIVQNTDGGVLRVRTPALPVGEHAVRVTTPGGVAVTAAGNGYQSVPNRPLAADGVRADRKSVV